MLIRDDRLSENINIVIVIRRTLPVTFIPGDIAPGTYFSSCWLFGNLVIPWQSFDTPILKFEKAENMSGNWNWSHIPSLARSPAPFHLLSVQYSRKEHKEDSGQRTVAMYTPISR